MSLRLFLRKGVAKKFSFYLFTYLFINTFETAALNVSLVDSTLLDSKNNDSAQLFDSTIEAYSLLNIDKPETQIQILLSIRKRWQ